MRTDTSYLKDLITEHALIRASEGEVFNLASGTTATWYFDAKRVILAPEGIPAIGKWLYDEAIEAQAVAVGGLSAGCIPIADAAVAYSVFTQPDRLLRSFYVRDEAKSHGTKESLYQAFSADGRDIVAAGSRVLIADDVLTTGKSISKAIQEIEHRGAVVAGIRVLVDRMDPRSQTALKDKYEVKALFVADENGNLSESRVPVLR